MAQVFVSAKRDNFKRVMSFHAQCYIPWVTDWFNTKWAAWKDGEGKSYRPKLKGRPPVLDNPTKEQMLARLYVAKSYHNKVGHPIKVEQIQRQIDAINHPST
jgi:hypothetical protein